MIRQAIKRGKNLLNKAAKATTSRTLKLFSTLFTSAVVLSSCAVQQEASYSYEVYPATRIIVVPAPPVYPYYYPVYPSPPRHQAPPPCNHQQHYQSGSKKIAPYPIDPGKAANNNNSNSTYGHRK